jgi:electron-transferring-flavoprotein dehydrogenase
MIERDVMEYDVVVVGAGPAGLAFAIRLRQLEPDTTICVLEKASEPGAHSLSGAVMEPHVLDALWPEWRDDPPSICVPAKRDELDLLTAARRIPLPTPPQQNNHGNFMISLGSLVSRMAAHAESLDIDVFAGFAAAEALIEDGRVCGIRCGDMGVARDGTHTERYAPGVDIRAKLTVLAEGCRGSVSKQLIARFDLARGGSPQTYGLGMKELWQLPPGRTEEGLVRHTIGWPLDRRIYGGSFSYHLDRDRVAIGFVAALDYADPHFSPFEAFQQWKHHPKVRPLLEGGEILAAGARSVTEGGFQSLPKLEMPGAMLVGDAAGTLNVVKIKGIHMAMECGVAGAEHWAAHQDPQGFDEAFRRGRGGRELYRERNIRPGFRRGMWLGLANAALETVTAGRVPWTLRNEDDHSALEKLHGDAGAADRNWVERDLPPRDRLASVYFAGNDHDENQPVHLRVSDTELCVTRCTEEYGNPCTRFCPAGVYEIVEDEASEHGRRLQINSANCVHCKACDIKDPYEVITWVPPEGGSGPNYQNL